MERVQEWREFHLLHEYYTTSSSSPSDPDYYAKRDWLSSAAPLLIFVVVVVILRFNSMRCTCWELNREDVKALIRFELLLLLLPPRALMQQLTQEVGEEEEEILNCFRQAGKWIIFCTFAFFRSVLSVLAQWPVQLMYRGILLCVRV